MAELKYVDWDGLVYYDGKIKEYIQDRDEDYVKMGGIVSFVELPDPTYYNLHYIYKITDDFISNNRFDTPGYKYNAGTWVQCVDLNDDASQYRYIIFNEKTIGPTADIDLSDYYTKTEVDSKITEAIDKLEVPEVDLTDYYTKSEIDALIPDIDNYLTKSDLDIALEDFVTTEQLTSINEAIADLDLDKASKSEIPTKTSQLLNDSAYITETELNNAIDDVNNNVDNLNQSVENLSATVSNKADSVPFTDGEVVGVSFGNFVKGDFISNMTLKEILTKLLQITVPDTSVTLNQTSLTLRIGESATLQATLIPENATNKTLTWVVSEGGESVVSCLDGVVTAVGGGNATVTVITANNNRASCEVSVTVSVSDNDQIKNDRLPVACLSGSELVATEWSAESWISNDHNVTSDATSTCFYEIVDKDTREIIEYGYQVISEESNRDMYQFAIPSTVTLVEVQFYDDGIQQAWVTYEPGATKTGTTIINDVTYDIYECGDASVGERFRFVLFKAE